ncbi:MAG: ferredoxin--NADP reductase [Phycisphaeraceae bacterium]|nr:ferredoxin--NADP reductase [Phycisphaeraceae bacterium]
MSDDVFNASIIYRKIVTPELEIVRVKPDVGQIAPFEPGQFCNLGLPSVAPPTNAPPRRASSGPRLVRRSYSIASSADVREYAEFYLVLVKEGRLTPRLWSLPLDGRVWLDPQPDGHFTLEGVPVDQDLVMIATGTGLGPYMSMIRTFRGRSQKRWRNLVLIHGARLSSDLGYMAELETIAREDPSVKYIPILSREPEATSWRGMRGRVQIVLEPQTFERLTGVRLLPDQTHVFLCGNPAMITEVHTNLETRGFLVRGRDNPEGNIHFEKYW